ncbi:MAG: DegV family protein [Oscillospiraceae bacterium]|nr:DegV family protein [Oscillospiraceae bacterium]
MNEYIIFTDSCCDIKPELLQQWGVPYANMTFSFDGEDKEYIGTDISNKEFYERMRQGACAKTAAINADAFARAFMPILEEGKDILYVAFSSGLSTTFNSAHMAAEELREQYPDRKIVIVDTLAASAGSGLMVYMAVAKKNEGASLEENAAYIESLTSQHCIWFTVDDLEYLKRGGRVSPLVAFAGGVLGIKPVLQMDSEGHLIKVSTTRGRKKAIEALADKYAELSYEEKNTPVFISHAECEEDAKHLTEILLQRHGVKVTLITEIGPVIGSHAGPGTLAIFFIGKHR